MKLTVRILLVGAFTLLAVAAYAKPEYLNVLLKTYPVYEKALSSRSCVNCHVSDSDYTKNVYGKQIAQQLLNAEAKKLTPEILHAIDNSASNPGDISILDKIKQGLAPAAVAVAGTGGATAAAGAATPPTTGAPARPEAKSIFPKNAFHPAIVHFPIALFLAALLLDLIGILRTNSKFLVAGWYNLIMAAVSSFGAIATGFFAIYSMGLPLKGLILQHLVLALIATVIMWVMVALRARRHDEMSQPLRAIYFVLALAGMGLISYSAHLGGAFVYGE